MSVVVVKPPVPFITLDEAKRHLRVDDYDNDLDVSGFLFAANGILEGPGGWLGRALGKQTLELRLPSFFAGECRWSDGSIALPYPPIQNVISITYLDVVGKDQVLDAGSYVLVDDKIKPRSSWPCPLWRDSYVRVRYVAGYSDDEGNEVPPAIKAAVKLMLGTLYEGRECSAATGFSGAVNALLAPYRIFNI